MAMRGALSRLDDAGFPVWDAVRDRVASAFAKRIDESTLGIPGRLEVGSSNLPAPIEKPRAELLVRQAAI
jgi:hypothetical protein